MVLMNTAAGNLTEGMTSALSTAFGNVQSDVISVITTALPYALGIVAVIMAIRIGIKFFKQTAK